MSNEPPTVAGRRIAGSNSDAENKQLKIEIVELKTANDALHSLMVSGEKRGAEKADNELAALKLKLEAAKAALKEITSAVSRECHIAGTSTKIYHGGVHENLMTRTLEALAQLNSDPKLVDYWCRDCRESFRAPRQPDPHAPVTPCLKGHTNTYEACRD